MAIVYVAPSPTGDDSRSYAQAQNIATPWATVGKCQASAVSGDTIVCSAGTHTWASVTFTKNFTIIGASPSTTIFDAVAGNPIWDWSSALLSISNLQYYRGILGAGFQNNFGSSGNGLTFENCILKDNIISNAAGNGLFKNYHSNSGGGGVITLNRCLINNPKMSAAGTSTGIFWVSQNYAKIQMLRTIISIKDATYGAQVIVKYESNATSADIVKNSILHNPSGLTVNMLSAYSGSAPTFTYSYSDFYNITGSISGTGILTSDPLFVDYLNNNFNPRPGSPCIGMGTNS